eukprot:1229629-Rhodomonas_salina.1
MSNGEWLVAGAWYLVPSAWWSIADAPTRSSAQTNCSNRTRGLDVFTDGDAGQREGGRTARSQPPHNLLSVHDGAFPMRQRSCCFWPGHPILPDFRAGGLLCVCVCVRACVCDNMNTRCAPAKNKERSSEQCRWKLWLLQILFVTLFFFGTFFFMRLVCPATSLCARYAMPGTEQRVWRYQFGKAAVLIHAEAPVSCRICYASATRCPVLTRCMLLPGAYAVWRAGTGGRSHTDDANAYEKSEGGTRPRFCYEVLRMCYETPGTDVGYAATRSTSRWTVVIRERAVAFPLSATHLLCRIRF